MPFIETLICREFKVNARQLHLQTRGRAKVAFARQCAIYLAHVVLGVSLGDLADHFDRDRTTIAHGCNIVEDRRDDRAFDEKLTRLENEISNHANKMLPPRKILAIEPTPSAALLPVPNGGQVERRMAG